MRKILIQSLFILIPLCAHAQITIEECQEKAQANYPEIANYSLIDESEQFNLKNASKNWIPQISLGAQATWQSAVASFPDLLVKMLEAQGVSIPGLARDQYKVSLDVNQTIWDGGVSKANREVVSAEAREQRLSNDVSLYAIRERVNDIYFGILLLDENYQTALSRKELLEANLSKLEAMKRSGTALQSDIDLVSVEMLTLGQQLDQNRSSRNNFSAMLSLFIGESIEGKQLQKPLAAVMPAFENNRPELKLIDAKIAGLDARDRMLNASLTPKFSFFAQSYYGNPGLDMFKSMSSRDWTMNAYLGIRMQWNISPFFTLDNDRKRIENSRRMLLVQKDKFLFNTDILTTRQNGEILRMQRALENDDEIVRLRSNVRKTAQAQREEGIIDTSTLLQRICEETTAQTTRSIHEIEMLKSIYELKYIVNQ